MNRSLGKHLSRILLLFAFLDCCSMGFGAPAATGAKTGGTVSVSISPANTSLNVGRKQQFNATISGTTNTGLEWMVNSMDGGNLAVGTISPSGLYTAPASVPSRPIVVTAESVLQPNATASASVSITASSPSISISVSPPNSSLQVGQSQQFTATVSGTSTTSVDWLVNGVLGGNSAVGTVSSSGLYTAPAAVPTGGITVMARSDVDITLVASASVSITTQPMVSVSISPSSTTVAVHQSQQFTAAVSGTSNTTVNWLVTGIQGGNTTVGTISSTGLYTAPASVPNTPVTVTAKSVADPASSAMAGVTIATASTETVSLSWTASTSSVAGYNIYRSPQSTGPFAKINSSLDTATVYTDSSVTSGQTYYYATTGVDSTGVESGYSNVVQAIIP
ncbi:MAG: Ig-like domain-containing protein [Acidobacteria bacterium]|nr:Ig-like domain-containing protein [Acidobacteriota bacterium]